MNDEQATCRMCGLALRDGDEVLSVDVNSFHAACLAAPSRSKRLRGLEYLVESSKYPSLGQ